MLRLTTSEAPAPLPFTRNRETGPAQEAPMNEQRIMDALNELEAGLDALRAEADIIDDLLAPIPFGMMPEGEGPDDDRPWAA
ncbi:MAG: hypothetical protein AAGB51_05655 [Planctomycetota bacterium]